MTFLPCFFELRFRQWSYESALMRKDSCALTIHFLLHRSNHPRVSHMPWHAADIILSRAHYKVRHAAFRTCPYPQWGWWLCAGGWRHGRRSRDTLPLTSRRDYGMCLSGRSRLPVTQVVVNGQADMNLSGDLDACGDVAEGANIGYWSCESMASPVQGVTNLFARG